MALEALVEASTVLARHLSGDHFEVHHVVARRSLMTLDALLRPRRGVAKLWKRPR